MPLNAKRCSRRSTIAVSLVAMVATAAGGSVTAAASPPTTFGAPTTTQLDQAISQAMRQEGIPGAIVGVWTPHGNYVRAFGISDTVTRAPMEESSYQRIGSITKTFTVTAVLQLVDQGKVRLDDPISKYVAGVPDGDDITIRELARMQSGLFDYVNDDAFSTLWVTHPYREWTSDELLQYTFRHPLLFRPGTSFAYTNANTVLLGLVVEKVTGQPLASYIQDHVVEPLHLDHTAFPSGNQFPSPHAQGYAYVELPNQGQPEKKIVTDWNPSWGWAPGAMYSDLNDMHVWAQALATGVLLSPPTQAQRLQTVPFKGAPGASYGLGIEGFDGWWGHYGNMLGYNSLEAYLPSQRATLVIFANIWPSKHHPKSSAAAALSNEVTKIISPSNVIGGSSAPAN